MDEIIFRSPEISPIPESSSERLIDSGMLHYESSVAGYNERYHRGETSHTIHVWWARRPHSAMRSLIFSSLCKDVSDNASAIMAKLAMSGDSDTITSANSMLQQGYAEVPRVLDMFGGGGTIPFEAKKLGLDSHSIDANQLSVFIQKCNMLYADMVDLKSAAKLTQEIGTRILSNLKNSTEWLYPMREKNEGKTFGYMWSYETTCPHCGETFLLIKRPWLSTKKDRKICFKSIRSNGIESVEICDATEGSLFSPHWERGTGVLHCPSCKQTLEKPDIKLCTDKMLATISTRASSGKVFAIADQATMIPSITDILSEEKKILNEISADLPTSELPCWSGVVNPALYGITTHADFLNPRQRLVLIYLIRELISEFNELKKTDENMAKFVIGVLSSLIDQVVDWNCRLSMWIQVNEQVGRAFCGPGIAMLWDYVETDQVLDGPANLWDKLKRIVKGVQSFEGSNGSITIKHAHAQDLPFPDNYFDAIVTDPPYYDNIYYSILADFFYAWKKLLLEKVEPSLFATQITDCKYELVASSRRVDEGESPHESYCTQLEMAFSEAARVIKHDGVFSFVYSHSSVNGWESVVRAYRKSPFIITSVQPLSIERKGRPRAVMSQAVNTCMTFVARKSNESKKPIHLSELLSLTEEYAKSFGTPLISESGWVEADAGLATLACSIGKIAASSSVVGCDNDFNAILECSKIVKKHFPEFTIKVRDSI